MTLRERLFGRKVWKVTRDNGRSIFAHGAAGKTYRRFWPATAPAWLEERGYYLTCFWDLKSVDRARANGLLCTSDRIYEARAWGVRSGLPPLCNLGDLALAYINPTNLPWPPGTLMAKRIMLIRRVA